MKKLLLAAALAVVPATTSSVSAAPASSPAAKVASIPDADPAMWVVKDDDTTIYLFGTFHALDGSHDWFNDEVKAAFDKSDELIVEAIMPADPAALQPLIKKYGIDPSGKPLTAKLSPKGQKALAKALADLGAPATAFDQFRPFFASTSLVAINAQKLGISTDKGTEAILQAAAKTAGKPVGELETAEFQLSMLGSFPDPVQVEMLEQTLSSMPELAAYFDRMKTAWYAGDAPGFVSIMSEMDKQSPAAFKVIFSDRNARWAEWIDQRLDRPGTVFVAVGTGHLAGRDSVQQFLAKRGFTSRRAD